MNHPHLRTRGTTRFSAFPKAGSACPHAFPECRVPGASNRDAAAAGRTRTTEAVGLPEQRITEYTLNAFGLITAITRKGGELNGSASFR